MTFKIISQLCAEGLRNKFIERSALPKYNTRNMKDLHVQKLKLEQMKKSFLYIGRKTGTVSHNSSETPSHCAIETDLKFHPLS